MMRRGLCLYTLVVLFVTVVVSLCFNNEFQGYLKRENRHHLCEDSSDWNDYGVCSNSPLEVASYSVVEVGTWAPNTTTTPVTISSDQFKELQSLGGNKINMWPNKPQVQSPDHIQAKALHDGFITIAVQGLNFFIAKCLQFRYLSPLQPRPWTMAMPFWLVFTPSIAFM